MNLDHVSARALSSCSDDQPFGTNESIFLHIYIYIYTHIAEVGGCSTGKSFCFVRAFVRAVWLPNGIGSQKRLLVFSLFPFRSPSFPFSLFGATSFAFSLPPHPPSLLSNFSWAYRSKYIVIYLYIYIGGWGVSPTGRSFRFVRACGLVAQWNWITKEAACIFPFPFMARPAFPFPFWGRRAFPFPSPPHPQTSYSTLVGLDGIFIWKSRFRYV